MLLLLLRRQQKRQPMTDVFNSGAASQTPTLEPTAFWFFLFIFFITLPTNDSWRPHTHAHNHTHTFLRKSSQLPPLASCSSSLRSEWTTYVKVNAPRSQPSSLLPLSPYLQYSLSDGKSISAIKSLVGSFQHKAVCFHSMLHQSYNEKTKIKRKKRVVDIKRWRKKGLWEQQQQRIYSFF